MSKTVNSVFYFFFSIFLLAFLFYRPQTIGPDQAMYLYSGKLILAGQTPFLDFFEINPPLIMYLSAAIVWIGSKLRIESIIAFKLFFIIWTQLCCILIWRNLDEKLKPRAPLIVGIVFLATIYSQLLTVYGERDQFFALSLLPYILARLNKTQALGLLDSLTIGVLMGVALSLKPYFLPHILFIEFYLAWKYSRWTFWRNIEFATSIGILLIYILILLMLPEPVWSNFWLFHIPHVIKYYDSFAPRPGDDRFMFNMIFGLGFITAIIFSWRIRKKSPLQNILLVNLWLALCIYTLKTNQFIYHLVVIEILFIFLNVITLTVEFKKYGLTCLSILFIWQSFYTVQIARYFSVIASQTFAAQTKIIFKIEALLNRTTTHGDYILPLSSSVWVTYPLLVRADLKLASRYLFQYPMSFYGSQRFLHGQLNDVNPLEKTYFLDVLSDIKKFKPKLIFYIDSTANRQNLPVGFSIEEYIKSMGLEKNLNTLYIKKIEYPITYFIRK